VLSVAPEVFAHFPDVRIGVIVARGVDNATPRPELVVALRAAEERVRRALAGVELAAHPAVGPWREAYRAFGAQPKKHRSSLESLLRRVLAGEAIRSIHPLVDLYNRVSLDHLLPAGGEDLERIVGPLTLRFAGPGEPAVLLLGDPEPRPPAAGELIYADEVGAVCRRWNWREADRTKLIPETRDAVLVLEALPPTGPAALASALGDLTAGVRALGGKIRIAVLDATAPSCPLR
jgi:DNA/RNA-binding domain of Phe-tRNA-synthetase-like protein